ncbi:hypothetical protein SAMN04488033_10352 [Salegentibacter agarivorans]|uniref:Uncharacterized protein n=1 Tax=Salegentibacter agarivorans TaxID=345907 RepID=A0A1I2KK33_9FLAO|nr:hypothetical protein SAMN04488033_10352 [Salegentibacter agarivorans]
MPENCLYPKYSVFQVFLLDNRDLMLRGLTLKFDVLIFLKNLIKPLINFRRSIAFIAFRKHPQAVYKIGKHMKEQTDEY